MTTKLFAKNESETKRSIHKRYPARVMVFRLSRDTVCDAFQEVSLVALFFSE